MGKVRSVGKIMSLDMFLSGGMHGNEFGRLVVSVGELGFVDYSSFRFPWKVCAQKANRFVGFRRSFQTLAQLPNGATLLSVGILGCNCIAVQPPISVSDHDYQA